MASRASRGFRDPAGRTDDFATCMPGAASTLEDLDFARPAAIVVGNEHDGLTSEAASACDVRFAIPMQGMTQSLNLSVATAVALAHAVRQRRAAIGAASDLDAATRAQLDRGQRLVELLKQGQYVPLAVEKQVVIIFAGTQGYVDKLPVESLRSYEEELYRFIDDKHADLWEDIRTKKEITDEIKKKLVGILKAFGKQFVSSKE